MKISRITVNNFCSIKHAELEPTAFNVLVGQNNHGKTNLFEAINWFYSGRGNLEEIRFGRKGGDEVEVELEFTGVQAALNQMKNEKNRSSIEKVLGASDTVRAKRTSTDVKVRKIYDESTGSWREKNPAGFDPAFNDFLPVFEYVDTSTHLADVAKYGKNTAIGNMLSSVLMALLETSTPYREFKLKFDQLFSSPDSDVRSELNKISHQVTLYIAKQFPDCTKVEFQVTEPAFEELLKGCTTAVDDGILTNAAEKGDGMQRALMLAILQTYADFRRKNEAIGKHFLFFIDEAELHLHPTAQRNLKNALKDIASNGDQVFINTHSSVLVVDNAPDERIFKIEKIDGMTQIERVSNRKRPEVIYELLGGSPADLLLPRNFLIVEGRSDFEFITKVIARFYPDKPQIQIVFSEGDFERQRRSMDSINFLLAPLAQNPVYKNRLVILCDAPRPERLGDFNRFLQSYPHLQSQAQIYALPTLSIEEYYPDGFRQTPEQVEELGRKILLKRDMAKHVASQITKEEFEDQMPIVKEALDKCWSEAHV